MNTTEVLEILSMLNIKSNDESWNVESAISSKKLQTEISVYEGESKLCLVFQNFDFVIKWKKPNSWVVDSYTDEAMRECEIYKKAQQQHLERFFPKTEFFANINGIDFILQEKIDFDCEGVPHKLVTKYKNISKTATDKIVRKMEEGFRIDSNLYNRELDNLWARMVISIYGKKMCKLLCDFIQENKINDLHYHNLGYKNNKPIILDFSGYYRD